MIYIDGKLVDSQKLDPYKHKFVGMFRIPNPPYKYKGEPCLCGKYLYALTDVLRHWELGHFDTCQYVTMPDYNQDNLHNMEQAAIKIYWTYDGGDKNYNPCPRKPTVFRRGMNRMPFCLTSQAV